jgi:hypothetical protein
LKPSPNETSLAVGLSHSHLKARPFELVFPFPLSGKSSAGVKI